MSTQVSFTELDPCRLRSRNNENSAQAHRRVVAKGKARVYREIYALIELLGPLTSKEIAKELDRPLNTISGRFSEMKSKQLLLLAENGDRREGAAVLMIARKWDKESL